MKPPRKILVTRTDRMGDTLLSLPSVVRLRALLGEAEILFLVRRDFFEILAAWAEFYRIRLVPYEDERTDWRFLDSTIEAAVLLFDAPGLAFRCYRAGVRVRVANRSKLRSFVWVNYGLPQNRSRAERNEAQYGLELVEHLAKVHGVSPNAPMTVAVDAFAPSDLSKAVARDAFERLRRRPDHKLVLLHPGMGGSAANLSVSGYRHLLIHLTHRRDCEVVLSEGPQANDREIVGALTKEFPGIGVLKGLTLEQLAAAFQRAELVIAPSTGTLHLAHYAGARTLGLFPLAKSQSAKRWQPWGGAGKSWVFIPESRGPSEESLDSDSEWERERLTRYVDQILGNL